MKVLFLIISFLMCTGILARSAEVIRIGGEVFVGDKKLSLGDQIEVGTIVEVGNEGSFIQFKFEDGSMILQKKGKLRFKKMSKNHTFLEMLKGKLFIYKKPDSKKKFNIKSKYATFAVRGTKFYLEDEFETYLCVCEGVVAVKNKAGKIDVFPGEDINVTFTQSLDKSKASKNMSKMAEAGFLEMGIPVIVN